MKIGVTTTNENRKIRTKFFGGTIHAVECACCCYAEVRSVTASLSHVGYLPFTCEGSEPPPTDTRYLKYRASGDGYIEACGVAPHNQNVTQEWEVDPFTGLTCYNGPESDIVSSGCSELQNCSATQKSYSCAFEGDPNDPCAPGSINWTESLQDSYTIEDVASNVDTALGRIDPYGNDGMPAGTRGSVINGTNGSILSWVNECALNRAEFTSGAGGVTKTKLFVKFTKDTQYTLTQSDGSVQTLNATEGQEITIDPPATPNTWTDIAIVNKTKVGCCNSSIGATTHTGETTDSTFVADGGAPPPPIPFIGPDCKEYSHYTTESIENSIVTASGPLEDGDLNGSGEWSYNRESTNSETGDIYGGFSDDWFFRFTENSFKEISGPDGWGQSSRLINKITSRQKDEGITCSGSIVSTYTNSGETETFESEACGGVFEGPRSSSNSITCCDTIIEGNSKIVKCNSSGSNVESWGYFWGLLGPQTGGGTRTVTEIGSSTSTTTFFGEVIQNGTWEDETSPNESLCASRTKSETTKQSKNVAAEIDLTFTAPASESPIIYEHWFHYYTVEVDSSEEGCPTSDVVAHNEKWTSVSSGGVLTLSRNINLSTPPKDHSICAQSLAFVTRVAS
jgi:hypothetical protein